jgi:cobalt-zinc-cadmium efflux system protein
MLFVGGLGLLINLISLLLLRPGAKESLNVKGAYFEVIADAIGSVGVIIAALLISFTGNGYWDVVIALGIGTFVAVRAVALGRQVLAVLGQHAPDGVDLKRVIADLEALEGVGNVHDLHAWTLTSGMHVATAHLVISPQADPQQVLDAARTLFRRDYDIEHATLQVESQAAAHCHEVTW